jgi:hypothetical protein
LRSTIIAEFRARAERHLPGGVRLGAEIGRDHVTFVNLYERQWTFTADALLDTRNDPAFPRRGVLARAVDRAARRRGRASTVTAATFARSTAVRAGRPRRAGRIGRRCAAAGVRALSPWRRLAPARVSRRARSTGIAWRWRRPNCGSRCRPLGGARTGVTIFTDAGAAFDDNQPLSSARFHRGTGGGLFLSASVFSLNLDVARSDQRCTRAHVVWLQFLRPVPISRRARSRGTLSSPACSTSRSAPERS